MKIVHQGFRVDQMVGGMSAEVREDSKYVEVVLIGVGEKRSFDVDGLKTFIGDLRAVLSLAEIVEGTNANARESSDAVR